MRLAFATVLLAALISAAKADPPKSVRVIEITRENAEKSAQAIAAAKNPLIGMPPARTIFAVEARDTRAEVTERTAQAKIVPVDDLMVAQSPTDGSDRARVQIIKPGKTGPVVETFLVPRR